MSGRGAYIRPRTDAVPEVYDPWQARAGDVGIERGPFRRGRRRPKQPPYATLIDLLSDPEIDRARGAMVPQLSPDAEHLLLDWCRRYGLLGISLHEIRSVSGRSEQWEWGLGGWIGRSPVRTEPGVEYRPIRGSTFTEWTFEPFERWLEYFPDATDAAMAPPGSEAFWRGYAEPIGEFLNAVDSLRDVLQAAAAHKREPRPDSRRITTFFNRFLDRVHPVIEDGTQRPWDGRRAAPSLLAMLVMTARDDLVGCSLHQCASRDCGRLFRSTARAVTYCSDTCRSREQKRKKP